MKKLLMVFMLLVLCGGGKVWAAQYVLNNTTLSNGKGTSKITFSSGFTISSNNDKTYNNSGDTYLKYSASPTHELSGIPVGEKVVSVQFTGVGNSDEGPVYISNFNGTNYTSSDYGFNVKGGAAVTHTISGLSINSGESITFKLTRECLFTITITTEKNYTVSYPYTWDFASSNWSEGDRTNISSGSEWTQSGNHYYNTNTLSEAFLMANENVVEKTVGLKFSGALNKVWIQPAIYEDGGAYRSPYLLINSVGSEGKLIIPDVPKGMIVKINLSCTGTGNATVGGVSEWKIEGDVNHHVSGTASVALSTDYKNYLFVANGGDIEFTAPSGQYVYFQKIEVKDYKPFTYQVEESGDGWKFYFTSTDTYGSFDGGYKMTDVPGIVTTFGVSGDDWNLADISSSHGRPAEKAGLFASSTTFHGMSVAGIPTKGSFLKLEPIVNGYFAATFDVYQSTNANYVLYDATENSVYFNGALGGGYAAYTEDKEIGGNSYPLIAGHVYYFYAMSKSSTNPGWYQLQLNGFKFTPAYLLPDKTNMTGKYVGIMKIGQDNTAITPYALIDKHDDVTFKSSNESVVTVDKNEGYTSLIQTGSGVTITCTITSPKGYKKEITYLLDVEKPTNVYMVAKGEQPNVGDQITTVEGITMTYGGWMYNDHKYNAKGDNNSTKNLTDSWGKAKDDEAGRDENRLYTRTIDGFLYATNAGRDGTDECLGDGVTAGWFSNLKEVNGKKVNTTFDIPCRGGYVMFEPEQNGTLSVYLLQNGCIVTYTDTVWVDDKNKIMLEGHAAGMPSGYITWRPYFITDEAGKEVEGITTEGKAPFVYTYDYIVNHVYQYGRDTYEGGGTIPEEYKYPRWRGNPEGTTGLILSEYRNWVTNGEYPGKGNYTGEWPTWTDDNSIDEEYKKPWKANGEISKPIPVPINLGGGWITMVKGFVKYEIPVKAGKTYFVFSNASKLGFCGFKFEGNETGAVTEQQTIANTGEYSELTSGMYKKIKLADRKFEAGKWTSLCLPFSVSAKQMRNIFGDNVATVHYNKITNRLDGEEKHIAKFDHHVYDQIIVAGVPVFVLADETHADVVGPIFENVTVENPEIQTYKEYYGYTFKGVYSSEDMGQFGYFINDKLYWLNKTPSMQSNTMRAYFKATTDNTDGSQGAKALSAISFDDAFFDFGENGETTAIDDVLADETLLNEPHSKDVYDLQGRKVAGADGDIRQLPKGIYIINGKKYVVR